jgi:hypothetical protein
MKHSAPTLEIEVVWADSDLQEVVVSASSEHFAGRVNLYAGPAELSELAEVLRGFPRSADDRREYKLGQDNLAGYGTARLVFFCKDSTGHVIAQVELRGNPEEPKLGAEFSVVQVTAVAADIDRFEQELRSINNHVGSSAALKSAA